MISRAGINDSLQGLMMIRQGLRGRFTHLANSEGV